MYMYVTAIVKGKDEGKDMLRAKGEGKGKGN